MTNDQLTERRLLVDLLHFFSRDGAIQQQQLEGYLAATVERKEQAHVDDPLVELATGLEVWADRYQRWNGEEAATLGDLSSLLGLILRKDQPETASIQSLADRHYWNIVRRYSREVLILMKNPEASTRSSIWDLLSEVSP